MIPHLGMARYERRVRSGLALVVNPYFPNIAAPVQRTRPIPRCHTATPLPKGNGRARVALDRLRPELADMAPRAQSIADAVAQEVGRCRFFPCMPVVLLRQTRAGD
jgi:hypothetical protein